MHDPDTLAALKALEMAPVDFDAYCSDPANRDNLQRLEQSLEGIASHAARLASYIGQRHGYGCGDQGHAKAVKKSNKAVKAVRKAFGYNTTHDLSY